MKQRMPRIDKKEAKPVPKKIETYTRKSYDLLSIYVIVSVLIFFLLIAPLYLYNIQQSSVSGPEQAEVGAESTTQQNTTNQSSTTITPPEPIVGQIGEFFTNPDGSPKLENIVLLVVAIMIFSRFFERPFR